MKGFLLITALIMADLLFRQMFIGYLFGIRSERQEVNINKRFLDTLSNSLDTPSYYIVHYFKYTSHLLFFEVRNV